jgi:hypothetical protein
MRQRAPLFIMCFAFGLAAYALLDFWSVRNAPLYKRLERQWQEDVDDLEASQKLPKEWNDVGVVETIGGTPETKEWLQRIETPIKPHKGGHYKLEILVVAWDEDGKTGALIQYDLDNLKTGATIWEQGRTLILKKPQSKDPWKAALEELFP